MRKILFTLGVAALVAACGTTPGERTVSGAGIGAGAGAAVGAVTGLTVVQGALIGAAAGGVTGALTSKRQVDLGKPAWKSGSGGTSGYDQSTVTKIQSGLYRQGYDPGPVDGLYGPRTESAIRAYQQANGLIVDGRPSPDLAARLDTR